MPSVPTTRPSLFLSGESVKSGLLCRALLQAIEQLRAMLALIDFAHPSVLDHQNAIGFLRQPIVMGHHDERDSVLPIHLAHDIEDLVSGAAVEVPGRFVG